MTNPLETLQTVQGTGPVSASVIWLHGLGASGHDFFSIVPSLQLPQDHTIRFIFPHAPTQPVTINGGLRMRAWYDIRRLDLSQGVDEEGIRASSTALEQLILNEIDSGVPAHRIILAGFSQGGVIALHTGLRFSKPLGGVLALSTYLGLPDQLAQERAEQNQTLPIFWGHGQFDPIVPLHLAEQGQGLLMTLDYSMEAMVYPMAHQVCPQELLDIRQWIIQCLNAEAS